MNRILLLTFSLMIIKLSAAQNNEEWESGTHKRSTALSIGSFFLIGAQEEFYADEKKISFILSLDYRRRRNNPNDYHRLYRGEVWNNNLLLRPGIRLCYNRRNSGFFNGVSILVVSEINKNDSALGYGGGASLGYKYIFRNQLFLEAEGFCGAARGRFVYDDPYTTSLGINFYAIADFRVGISVLIG